MGGHVRARQAKTTAAEAADHIQLSDILQRLAAESGPRITLRDLAVAMQDRSFGAFLVVFALPNLIPLPPGATFILGLPLIFVAWQMVASRDNRIHLPKRMGDYAFDRDSFQTLASRITPWLKRAEKLVKPRAWFVGGRLAERLIGVLALILAIVIFLPIPFGNWLPAFALAVMGFALTERDGVGLAASLVIGIASLVLVSTVIFAAGALLSLIF
ncbi:MULTISPECIES: exopolysaccharide biosynthesis protein [unclassified Rhizobium]|uniref:exopolysaccharide biosynthesis protein n=1 Tax=unclassified Rhizobium TaxID=2613769 RepID=UPI001FCCC1B8|nr:MULTISPECIES: exopolysaccharide biosynthesis protein [unclassified Rhizobium]